MTVDELISLNQAVERKITRICCPNWAITTDYIGLDIIDGKLGPWASLYSTINMVIPTTDPHQVLWVFLFKEPLDFDKKQFVQYTGELDEDDSGSSRIYNGKFKEELRTSENE